MTRALDRAERDLATARDRLRDIDGQIDAAATELLRTPHDSRDRGLVVAMLGTLASLRESWAVRRAEAERARALAAHDPVTGRPVGEGIAGHEDAIREDVAAMRRKMGEE